MMRLLKSKDERGSVLLTVLLIVTVLSVTAVAMMDDLRFAIRRAANVQEQAQAQLYALGAEQFAIETLAKAGRAFRDRSPLMDRFANGPLVFTLDEGAIEAHMADGSNCFNLNSVVTGETRLIADEESVHVYQQLLKALDFSDVEQERLANALVDWIDTDGRPVPRGAEDYHYQGLKPPYRAANTLLAETSELRAIRGYTPETYLRLRRHVCARPTTDRLALNVNTLREGDEPLLVMVMGDKLSLTEARAIIEARPPDGYRSLEAFWQQDGFAGKAPNDEQQALVSLKTRFYELKLHVAYSRAYVSLSSLLEQRAQGGLTVISRRYGATE